MSENKRNKYAEINRKSEASESFVRPLRRQRDAVPAYFAFAALVFFDASAFAVIYTISYPNAHDPDESFQTLGLSI